MNRWHKYTGFGIILLCLFWGTNLCAQEPVNIVGTAPDPAHLTVTSSPDSAFVTISSHTATELTPVNLALDTGTYQVEVAREGFEPLTHELNLLAGQRLSAQFILKSFPPPPIPAESLGLFYLPEKILEDINDANRMGQSFKRLAETFAIIPLGQGILARLILDKEDRGQADILIISGVVLSGGSLLLGKILSGRKRRNIERDNARIAEENIIIGEHNRDVDRELKEKNEDALQMWRLENENRGRVLLEEY